MTHPLRRIRTVALSLVAGLVLFVLPGCDNVNTLQRPDEPVVLTGSDLDDLRGADPDSIVAFRHIRLDGTNRWTQIPVQVDERVTVDFGQNPAGQGPLPPGETGTVYGTPPVGTTALQYADPGTFTGPDDDQTFDADDELVFMAGDAQGRVPDVDRDEPAGVEPGSGVEVAIDDPLGDDEEAWVYLFRSQGRLDPAAGEDHVDYDFSLERGDYKPTYARASGPNPESSVVTTDTYEARMTDRWDDADWRISTDGASGADFLDGLKNRFSLGTCVRSNITFQNAEGAFVANIDGPVRAIRSYVGANSGPFTQRTNVFYPTHQEIRTDLRVHAIPGVMDYLDYAATAVNSTYASSTHPTPVDVDGVQDPISDTLAHWELVRGDFGSVITTVRAEASYLDPDQSPDDIADQFYRDEANTDVQQCWGDGHFGAASGRWITSDIPNTDPSRGSAASLHTERTVAYGTEDVTTGQATTFADRLDAPLAVSTRPYSVSGS